MLCTLLVKITVLVLLDSLLYKHLRRHTPPSDHGIVRDILLAHANILPLEDKMEICWPSWAATFSRSESVVRCGPCGGVAGEVGAFAEG